MKKLGVIHYNWPDFSFEDFLRAAAEQGYGYVELMSKDIWPSGNYDGDLSQMREAAQKVRREVESHGLKVSALGAGNDFAQVDPEAIEQQVARMKTVCQLTRELGDETVVRSEGGNYKEAIPEGSPQVWDAMYECFSRCTPFLDELGVSLAIDNHGYVTNEGDKFIALLDRLDHPRLGSNLDTMNFRWWGNNIATCNSYYTQLAPRVLHVHLKDGFDGRQNYKGQALGEGEVDLQHAINALNEVGYNGVFTAEYEGPEAAGGVGYAKCAQWMKENL
jgi:sugar phosphate isomerase/epimerase